MHILKALFIGRFQPLHSGHLWALKQIDSAPDIGSIIIGIGSSQYARTQDNPFSFDERKQMIEESLHIQKTFSIIAIPDIHNLPAWPAHVESIVGKCDVLYSGNEIVLTAFPGLCEVRKISPELHISGSRLRQMIADGKSGWTQLVPPEVIPIINAVYGQSDTH